MFKKILAIACMGVMLMTSGCGEKPAEENGADTQQGLYKNKINFTIEMKDGGVMKGELYPDLAPKTVENFVSLCDKNFYDGIIFHRVIPGFMIQGGGYDEKMKEKQAESIPGEFTQNGFENDLKHEPGVLSMARTNDPDSASSQFFIMHETSPHLDGQYAAFGKVTEGLDVVDEIANVETTTFQGVMEDYPAEPQVIKTIKIEK